MKYCPDVWKSLYIEKKSTDTIAVGFCCQSNTTTIPANTESLLAIRKQLQHQFQDTKNPLQCNSCWKIEDRGSQSRRHAILNWFDNNYPASDTTSELISLDWNSENICNLACISCGPQFSSRWRHEIANYSFNNNLEFNNCQDNNAWKILDLSRLQRLYFNGGEPLLVNDHKNILAELDRINQLSNVEVTYNTNCSIMPDAEVINYWSKAKLVKIYLSIDAIDSAFEYIRWPAKWTQVLNFIQSLNKQAFNIMFDITCTIGIHNILEVDKLISWQQSTIPTNSQGDPVAINFQLVGGFSHGGQALDLAGINANLASVILSKLTKIKEYNIWLAIHSKLITANGSDPWLPYLTELASHRKINWQDYLLALAEASNRSHTSGI